MLACINQYGSMSYYRHRERILQIRESIAEAERMPLYKVLQSSFLHGLFRSARTHESGGSTHMDGHNTEYSS